LVRKCFDLFRIKDDLDIFDRRRFVFALKDRCSSRRIPRSLYERESGFGWFEWMRSRDDRRAGFRGR
jgi:hypothetical protein